MPKVSRKGSSMPDSPIRKLDQYASEAKARGVKVIHLNIGQPDIESHPAALKAISNYNSPILAYTASPGMMDMRIQMANYYQRMNIMVNPAHILVMAGGSEALCFTMLSILDEGDELIAPEPLYANFIAFAHMAGATLIPVNSEIESGFALPHVSHFEEKISDKTKAILLCNPSNPTGYVYSKSELQDIAQLVLKYDLFLIVDEVYREFFYGAENVVSALNLEGLDQHVIVCDSASKRFSLCGVRLGNVVSRNKSVLDTINKFSQARLSAPLMAQVAGIAAYEAEGSYFATIRDNYQKRRDYLHARLSKIPGVVAPLPEGAFYIIARLPVEDTDDFCKWLLTDFSLDGYTLMMAPASGFYITPGKGKQEVRMAYVLEESAIEIGMNCLEKALKTYTQLKPVGDAALFH
jgi:aspartate aminotransferase